jgi:hypothetical protein
MLRHNTVNLSIVKQLALGFFLIGVFFFVTIGNSYTQTNTRPEPLPRDIAKAWFEALFRADAEALRQTMCMEQREFLTDEALQELEDSIMGANIVIDTKNVVYDYDSETQTVTVSGELLFVVDGISLDVPMTDFPFPDFPMVREEGQWLVCLAFDEVMPS